MQRPRSRALLVAGLAALAAAGCGGGEAPPSLLLVTIDTLRADRLGCYGRQGAGTPNLDALAAAGVRFERAYTHVPITLPSHTALFTGTTPPRNGVRDNGQFHADPALVTLAEILAERDYRTGAFVAAFPLFASFGLSQGFDVYGDTLEGTEISFQGENDERPAEKVVAEALDWLRTVPDDEPFFLWVHLFDPHWPYEPPEPYATHHAADPYQGEVAYADAQLGVLLDRLRESGRLANTVVFATSDHGEGLGEHGESSHGYLLYDSTVRIPLIVAGDPGRLGHEPGAVVEESVAITDVLPTVVELFEASLPAGVEGTSLVPLLRGGSLAPREHYLESQYGYLHHRWSKLEGLVSNRWKYIEAPTAARETDELFDLRADPAERSNRALELAGETRELRSELAELRARGEPSYDASHEVDEATAAALSRLGYVEIDQGTDSQAEVHPRDSIAVVSALHEAKGMLRAGRMKAARIHIDRLRELEPNGVPYHFSEGLYALGMARTDRAHLRRAEAEFRAALAIAPGRSNLWRHLFEALWAQGEALEALNCLQTAQELSPSQPVLARMLQRFRQDLRRAAVELEAAGEKEEALGYYVYLAEKNPADASLRRKVENLRSELSRAPGEEGG